MEHLIALKNGLANEKARLAKATKPSEVALRTVWVAQLEKEIAHEYKFLGIEPEAECDMTDDELLAELLA